MKKVYVFLIVVLLLTACGAKPANLIAPTSAAPAAVSEADAHTARFNALIQACKDAGMAAEGNVISGDVKCVPAPQPTVAVVETQPVLQVPLDVTQGSSESTSSNGWTLKWFPGADLDRGDGTTFRQDAEKLNWREIAPELWPTFPNVPNPLVPKFRVVNGDQVPDGLEYAMDESNFCQQLAGEDCRVPVAAMHYFLFTGDYDIPEVGACAENGTGTGCALVIVNVGKVTADFTGMFSQGFRLHARYWNGDAIDMAMWALTSHTSNVMLNLESKLNPNGIQNAGANCSVPSACESVNVRVVFISGNELLLMLETIVER